MTDYAFVHNFKAYTPNQTAVEALDVTSHNAAVQAAELAKWNTMPDRFLAYYDEKAGTITTWLGVTIGQIVSSRIYRHNFGARMIAVRMRGTNGASYYGRASYDGGNAIHLRKAAK